MFAFFQHPAATESSQGDSTFLHQIVSHQDWLRRMARRMTRNSEDADDLIQETCFRAWRYRNAYVPGVFGIGPWLATILRNVRTAEAKADVRFRRTQAAVASSELSGDSAHGRRQPVVHTYEELLEHLDGRLARAIHSLPSHYREPLILWAIDGLTYDEIAAWLEIPVGTVLSRLARARGQLGERLTDLAAEWRPASRQDRPQPALQS